MKDTITAHSIASLARMLRAGQPNKKPIILVEGETDELLLQHCFGSRVDTAPAHGKALASEAAQILYNETGERAGYLAIVDADFDHILGTPIEHPAILVSDLHDFECEYIKSPALDKVLREYGSLDKIARSLGLSKDLEASVLPGLIRKELHKAACVIGALRLLSIKANLSLDFKDLRHEKLFEPRTITINKIRLLELIKIQNPSRPFEPEQAILHLDSILLESHDPWQLCQGHDLIAIFGLGMRRMWGKKALDNDTIESSLRLAFELSFLLTGTAGKNLASFVTEFESRVRAS